MNRLTNRVAIVTGAGTGIGRAIAEVLASEAAQVLIADVDEEAGDATAEEIRDAGGVASFVAADVSRLEDVEHMAETAEDQYGQIDILCANAGVFPQVRLAEMSEADWDYVLDVNLKGFFLSLKACLPYLQQSHAGRVIATSSITGNRTGISGLAHYAASKGGINGFIKTAAMELAPSGITVNGVEPGNILTEGMERQLGDDYIKAQEAAIPLGRMGSPEDVAYAVLYLASDAAKFVTGQTIVVDGGQILPESKFALEG
jgi:3-oxoacyl-[acyl-carrier protein] reductase